MTIPVKKKNKKVPLFLSRDFRDQVCFRNRSGMFFSLRKKQFKLSESSILRYLGGCCMKTLLCFQDILKGFLGTRGLCSRCLVLTLALDYAPAFLHCSDGNYCSSPMLQWSGLPLVCCAPGICLSVGSCPCLQQSDSSLAFAIALEQSCCRHHLPIQSRFPCYKFCLQTAVTLSSFKPEIIAQVQT